MGWEGGRGEVLSADRGRVRGGGERGEGVEARRLSIDYGG